MKRREWFIAAAGLLIGVAFVVLWLFPQLVPQGPARLLFLLDLEGVSGLWLIEPEKVTQRLTSDQASVWDYAPLAEDSRIVYSRMSPDEENALDLFMLSLNEREEQLLECPGARCLAPAPQPGGRLLAYERQRLDSSLDSTELWLLDLDTGETVPTTVPESLAAAGYSAPLGRFPRWSPDGRYLASYRRDANTVVIHDFAARDAAAPLTIPANLETMAGWSPDSRKLAFTETILADETDHDHEDESGNVISHTQTSLVQHVVIADVNARQTTDISAGLEVSEGRPAWHPKDDMLAIPRTTTGTGRQIWLVPLDGSEATQVTDDPFHDHTALAWSPDGRILAFMRVARADGAGTPTLYLYDMESGDIRPVVEGGFLPGWLP
jgi:Tol biopolymer transport system component